MFDLYMLPARYGDCLWLEYGTREAPKRILVDCGTSDMVHTLENRILNLPEGTRRFELLVISHIDADHIGGVLPLLRRRKELGVEFGEIWFNGRHHVPDDTLGPKDGNLLTDELNKPDLRPLWNKSMCDRAVMVPEDGALPVFHFGGLTITLLSPDTLRLKRLAASWPDEVRKAGIGQDSYSTAEISSMPDDTLGDTTVEQLAAAWFTEDGSRANGSSIAFLAEYGERRILFGADAFPSVLLASLARMDCTGAVRADVCKLPHHGSKANVNAALIAKLDCRRFLFSSNGERFNHPDKEAVARVILTAERAILYFNYRTRITSHWDSYELRARYTYETVYLDDQDYLISLEG